MYGQAAASAVDWSLFRLTERRTLIISLVLIAISVLVTAVQFSRAVDYAVPGGGMIGGDYLAFDVAAQAASLGRAGEAYDAHVFQDMLKAYGPSPDVHGLTWQYPPTYFLIILPLALVPYLAGYALWTGGTCAFFLAAFRSAGFAPLFLIATAASIVFYQAALTGQNGFLTAGLLLTAAYYPDKRPILAGAAAALLTVKPQLGVLLPIAYAAGGHWRSFFTAAVGALLLAGAATFVFGAEIWSAFVHGLSGATEVLGKANFPLHKMTTAYASMRFLGFSDFAALLAQIITAGIAACAAALLWRRVKDAALRAAGLIALVFFATPYGFYYELVCLAFPMAILTRRGLEKGFLRGEELTLVALFVLPMALPGDDAKLGFPGYFLYLVAFAGVVFRRVLHDEPQAFAFSRAVKQ